MRLLHVAPALLAALSMTWGAHALANCSVQSLAKLEVPHVTVVSATPVAADGPKLPYCKVQGTLVTDGDGAGPSSAVFVLLLPDKWNGKYLYGGVRAEGGFLISAANAPDLDVAMSEGYASVTSDVGHPRSEKNWYHTPDGAPNLPKLVDYFYRATHQVTVATKQLVIRNYGHPIARAYFDGCSNGGRQALMEAIRYPDDFDAMVVGCPWVDPAGSALLNVQRVKAFLQPGARIPLEKFAAIDQAVLAQCDALDGVKDGLIQNPARCSFDPHSLVPRLLTKRQADALDRYLDAVRDVHGDLVAPGSSVSRLEAQFTGVHTHPDGSIIRETSLDEDAPYPTAAQPWGKGDIPHIWESATGVLVDLAFNNPNIDLNNGIYTKNWAVKPQFLEALYERLATEIVADPGRLRPFLAKGGKIIIYHGLSDVTISGYGTILYYEQLAKESGGYHKIQSSVRLFTVPGMQHCNDGPTPVFFDTLHALDHWMDGVAPEGIVATYTESWGKKPTRTLPLCKFPEQARYGGKGDVKDAANWSCPPADRSMLEVARNGEQAGMKADLTRYTTKYRGMPLVSRRQ